MATFISTFSLKKSHKRLAVEKKLRERNFPATMTRDNLYWLSHDQVALFKTFRGTASRCKQTINHAVPRIKQSNR
ncbi:hypothetical protein Lal_00026535 [Lupinus albus]|nr:hypothetical protein Lal_00026535 [Lupinus albus]